MKTMACDTVGTTSISVHTAEPPSKEEWERYIAMVVALLDRVGVERARHLVFTQGGGPSFSQRQQINDVLRGRASPAAVVSANAFIRGIVAALALFNPKIKVFRPEAVGDAFRYLGISEAEGKLVWRTATRLKAELGLTSKPAG